MPLGEFMDICDICLKLYSELCAVELDGSQLGLHELLLKCRCSRLIVLVSYTIADRLPPTARLISAWPQGTSTMPRNSYYHTNHIWVILGYAGLKQISMSHEVFGPFLETLIIICQIFRQRDQPPIPNHPNSICLHRRSGHSPEAHKDARLDEW